MTDVRASRGEKQIPYLVMSSGRVPSTNQEAGNWSTTRLHVRVHVKIWKRLRVSRDPPAKRADSKSRLKPL